MIIPPGKTLAPLEPEPDETPASPPRRRVPRKRHTADRFGAINSFVDVTLRSLTRTEALVWVVLWRDTRHGLARTSYAGLARTSGCRRATVGIALRSLREKGLLEVVRRGGKGQGSNVYRLRSVVEGP
jgi:hypothetical protein